MTQPHPHRQAGRAQEHGRCLALGAEASLGSDSDAIEKEAQFAEEIKTIVTNGPHIMVGGKVLNPCGLFICIVTFAWCAAWYLPLVPFAIFSHFFDRKKRRLVDWVVHFWAKTSMLTCLYRPKVTGLENLPKGEAVMFIPNHTSFLDIFSLSGFIPCRMKYVSKIEILRIPLIGWAMRFAGHIAIRRTDRRSQMQTFKDTIQSLMDGNSVVTFAEGTRSKDGTLKKFKKGPFKMCNRAGVRVVPVSICDLHRWMPSSALLPLAFPRRVEIKIHPVVDTDGRKEEDVLKEVYKAVNDGLPDFQKSTITPLPA